MSAKDFVITTANGERNWLADDEGHAREQHIDAFDGHPGEEIISVVEAGEQVAAPPAGLRDRVEAIVRRATLGDGEFGFHYDDGPYEPAADKAISRLTDKLVAALDAAPPAGLRFPLSAVRHVSQSLTRGGQIDAMSFLAELDKIAALAAAQPAAQPAGLREYWPDGRMKALPDHDESVCKVSLCRCPCSDCNPAPSCGHPCICTDEGRERLAQVLCDRMSGGIAMHPLSECPHRIGHLAEASVLAGRYIAAYAGEGE